MINNGCWAAKLRLDQPLIIAELIRQGFFESLEPQCLCAMIGVFVNDKFRDIDIDDALFSDRLGLIHCYNRMKADIQDMVKKKQQCGFTTPELQFWPAAALYQWSMMRPWEEVLQLTGADEGDLAMLVFRTADNLRQIASLETTHPGLALKARQCVGLLLREPVIIPV